MDQGLRSTGSIGPSLAGLLAQLAVIDKPGDSAAGKPSFVDGLGQWLGWADAIALSTALHAPLDKLPTEQEAGAGVRPRRSNSSATTVRREFERVRAELVRAIEDTPTDADFAPHRRRYRALQQSMEAAIGPLRARLREALARQSPAMGRLAALDAVMDEALREREQSVLSAMPSLLQKHFERLQAGQPAPAPGPWLDEFRRDMQRMLIAELDLRLQPALGLLEALHSAITRVS